MRKEINYKGVKFLMTVEIEAYRTDGKVFHTFKTSHLGARNWQIENRATNSTLKETIENHTRLLQEFVDKDKSEAEQILESLGFSK